MRSRSHWRPAPHRPLTRTTTRARSRDGGTCAGAHEAGPWGLRLTAGRHAVEFTLRWGSKTPLHAAGAATGDAGASEPEAGQGDNLARERPRVGAVGSAQRVRALVVGAVHTASHKPARRRLTFQLVTADRRDGDIRFVFGVACCAVPGAFPERETRHQNVTGGTSRVGRLARPRGQYTPFDRPRQYAFSCLPVRKFAIVRRMIFRSKSSDQFSI